MKTGRMSPEEDARVEFYAERGFSVGRVAEKLDRHKATINWAFYRLGLKDVIAQRQVCYRRGKSIVRSFSDKEDIFIQVLRVQGYSTIKIADVTTRRFGHPRSSHTISMRLRMLANVKAA